MFATSGKNLGGAHMGHALEANIQEFERGLLGKPTDVFLPWIGSDLAH